MLATTNRLTDEREFLELQPFEVQVEIAQENHELATSREIRLAQLADIRIEIEQRGIWQEYSPVNTKRLARLRMPKISAGRRKRCEVHDGKTTCRRITRRSDRGGADSTEIYRPSTRALYPIWTSCQDG